MNIRKKKRNIFKITVFKSIYLWGLGIMWNRGISKFYNFKIGQKLSIIGTWDSK